ncbi:MAG: hypothetical protein PHI18_06795, partial [bacterium]|nr:hypothetical protein [bacterium]
IHFRTPRLDQAQEQGLRIAAVRVHGVGGLLSEIVQPGRMFAHEVSGRVRVIACLDEMPNLFYTGAQGEFELFPSDQTAILAMTGADEQDVVVVVCGPAADVTTALNETMIRIREATQGVPSETRQARRGGWTDFERILPGPNRMYPDTDSPPTIISPERAAHIRGTMPEPPWEKKAKLLGDGMSEELADGLIASAFYGLYQKVQSEGRLPANRVARVLVQDARAAHRRKGNPRAISPEAWRRLFQLLREGALHWEAVPILVMQRSRRPGADWMTIAAKQQMLPLAEPVWRPLVEAVRTVSTRSRCTEGRVRWWMGQLQRPPGRIPARQAAELLEEALKS